MAELSPSSLIEERKPSASPGTTNEDNRLVEENLPIRETASETVPLMTERGGYLTKEEEKKMEEGQSATREDADKSATSEEERSLEQLIEKVVAEAESAVTTGMAEHADSSSSAANQICILLAKSFNDDENEDLMELAKRGLEMRLGECSNRLDTTRRVVESFFSVARSPVGAESASGTLATYAPALVLAQFAFSFNSPENNNDKKWNSTAETASEAFRRDLMDLLGRRLFAMGATTAMPATPEDVTMVETLLKSITKEEFDGPILRPLKFRIMSSPALVMGTLASILDFLTEEGNGNYVEDHLLGGTNLVGSAITQLQGTEGREGAVAVLCSIVEACPGSGARAIVEGISSAFDRIIPINEDEAVGLCVGLEAIAMTLRGVQEEGQSWSMLATTLAIPTLKSTQMGGEVRASALEAWNYLEQRAPASAAPEEAQNTTRAAIAQVPASPGAAALNTDVSEPGAHSVSLSQAARLDERITAKLDGAANRPQTDPSPDQKRTDCEKAKIAAGAVSIKATASSVTANKKSSSDEMLKAAARSGQPDPNPASNNHNEDIARLDERIRVKAGSFPPTDTKHESTDVKNFDVKRDINEEYGDTFKVIDGEKSNELTSFHVDSEKPEETPTGIQVLGSAPQTVVAHGAVTEPEVQLQTADNPANGLSRGMATQPDVEFGEQTNPLIGHNQPRVDGDGLAVAVAVQPNDDTFDREYIPSAIEYDPDAKPPLYRNRRFRIYGIASVCIIVMVVIVVVSIVVSGGGSSGISSDASFTPKPSEPPSAPPTTVRDKEGIYDVIADAINREPSELKGGSSDLDQDPAAQAAVWMVNEDPRELDRDDPQLLTRFALATLYFSTGGWNWTSCSAPLGEESEKCTHYVWFLASNTTGYRFLSGEHHCEWYGIECTDADLTLKKIFLDSLNLAGKIPSEIAVIRSLQHLRMIDNFLTGPIPPELGSMNSIVDIEINSNLLTGMLPDKILENSQLQRLNLGTNSLAGTISTRIGDLTSLKGLFLFYNVFSGRIPTEIANLEHLMFTRFSGNPLSGTMPSEFGKLDNLRELYLQRAGFTGSIPESYRNLKRMEDLLFNGNEITGTMDVLYEMKQISFLYGYDNRLTGTIDSKIGELTQLARLVLRRNSLRGQIPDEIVRMPHTQSKLDILWFHYNDFTGTLTDDLCELYDVNLRQVYADCLGTANSEPTVVCNCCTNCCVKANGDQQEECKQLEA